MTVANNTFTACGGFYGQHYPNYIVNCSGLNNGTNCECTPFCVRLAANTYSCSQALTWFSMSAVGVRVLKCRHMRVEGMPRMASVLESTEAGTCFPQHVTWGACASVATVGLRIARSTTILAHKTLVAMRVAHCVLGVANSRTSMCANAE